MSGTAARVASKIGSAASTTAAKAAEAGSSKSTGVLQKGAKRDPELYVRRPYVPSPNPTTAGGKVLADHDVSGEQILLAIMSGAFTMAGWHFGRKPTSSSSEAPVSMAEGTMPWQVEGKGKAASENFKYQYHPGGDPKAAPKNAPSALHSVIVPNVNLPKELHEKYNKWGKDDY